MEGKNRSPHFAFRRRRKKNHKPQQLSFLPGLSSASLLTVKSLYIPSLSTWHVYANMSSSIQRKSRLSLSTMCKHFAPSPSRHFPLNAHRLAEAGKAKHNKRHAVWPNKIFKKKPKQRNLIWHEFGDMMNNHTNHDAVRVCARPVSPVMMLLGLSSRPLSVAPVTMGKS